MANVYTTKAKVLDEAVKGVPTAVQDLINGWIADESRVVDAALPNYATPFRDIAGSPATPPSIEKITRYLVADRVMQKSGLNRYDDAEKITEGFASDAATFIRRLRDGSDVIPESQL